MPTLWLTPAQVREIVQHARAEQPDEACGLLLGTDMRVTTVQSAMNVESEPRYRFRIDDQTLAAHVFDAIGFYHSHPAGNAIPSRSDIAESCYPEHVYLIVGLRSAQPELAAWRIRQGRVEGIQLHISNLPPPEPDELVPSRAQKVAIGLSALIGVLLVLIVALSLLPPAPAIP